MAPDGDASLPAGDDDEAEELEVEEELELLELEDGDELELLDEELLG